MEMQQELKQRPCRIAACCLAQQLTLSQISYTTQDHLPRERTGGWRSHIDHNQDSSPDMAKG